MTLQSLRRIVFPSYTRRWLAFSIVREMLSRPTSVIGRVNRTNIAIRGVINRTSITCNICGNTGRLFYDMPDIRKRRDHEIRLLRETAECRSCGGTMRHRTLAAGLLEQIGVMTGTVFSSVRDYAADTGHADIMILDTDCFSPLHKLLRGTSGYRSTKYIPDMPFGEEIEPGIWNNDLQQMKFDGDTFDIVLSSDVMEHVSDDKAAHREISRVLKRGGSYIFTVPYNPNYEQNRNIAIETVNGTLILEQPHYHGDPLTGGILAYRIYGRELVRFLENIGMRVAFIDILLQDKGIFNGDYFVASKN